MRRLVTALLVALVVSCGPSSPDTSAFVPSPDQYRTMLIGTWVACTTNPVSAGSEQEEWTFGETGFDYLEITFAVQAYDNLTCSGTPTGRWQGYGTALVGEPHQVTFGLNGHLVPAYDFDYEVNLSGIPGPKIYSLVYIPPFGFPQNLYLGAGNDEFDGSTMKKRFLYIDTDWFATRQ